MPTNQPACRPAQASCGWCGGSGIVVVPEFAKPMAAFAIAHNAFHFPFYPSTNMPFCSMLKSFSLALFVLKSYFFYFCITSTYALATLVRNDLFVYNIFEVIDGL
jgi:hypothetical protein